MIKRKVIKKKVVRKVGAKVKQLGFKVTTTGSVIVSIFVSLIYKMGMKRVPTPHVIKSINEMMHIKCKT